MQPFVQGLALGGWKLNRAPAGGRIKRNGQLLVLRSHEEEFHFRVFIYKITGSSRGRPDERRIEITSTYQKGLRRIPRFRDVVLGYDPASSVFVGVDPRRIKHGGATGNASSFFDREGLSWTKKDEILVRPRIAKLFSGQTEFHAFLNSNCLGEYLLNLDTIHRGTYLGGKLLVEAFEKNKLEVREVLTTGDLLIFVGRVQRSLERKASPSLVRDFEERKTSKLTLCKVSADVFQDIKRRCEENGILGEEYVLNYERRRLRKAGKPDLAARVKWISQDSMFEGYDILSFEINGRKRFVEVKTTSGTGLTFEISKNEWECARVKGGQYFLYRVTRLRTNPEISIFCDPVTKEKNGELVKTPSGWILKVV